MSDLKPCPFCGGECQYTDTVYFAVKCRRCNAIGPPSFDAEIAISAWNARAATPVMGSDQDDETLILRVLSNGVV